MVTVTNVELHSRYADWRLPTLLLPRYRQLIIVRLVVIRLVDLLSTKIGL